MATLPPILLRSTYPPGQPEIGGPPLPTKTTPTGVDQIETPGTLLGTLFQGPVVSGPTPGIEGAFGSAMLCACFQVDSTQSNYQIPITFPGGSFLMGFNAVTLVNGLTAFATFGTQPGQDDINVGLPFPSVGSVQPDVAPLVQLPLWNAALPELPFTMWLNVSANSTTVNPPGMAIILVKYVRLTPPWSAPAKNWNKP